MGNVAYKLDDRRAKSSGIFARHPDEWYVEPVAITRALLRYERFVGLTWDMACGMGNICRAFRDARLPVVGTDIVRRGRDDTWWQGTRDFLADDRWLDQRVVNVACNVPFGRAITAERFIRKALRHARGLVAIFVDIRFLAGGGRAEGLYAEFRPSRVYHTGYRVSCPPGEYILAGRTPKGGQQDWCWLVWDRANPATRTDTEWFRRDLTMAHAPVCIGGQR